ncbi:hypothetical protein ACFVWN_13255 [Nocardiopsis flavescens]|uniref:hypothetical protein n=1 Tax=Nocardiopsis flavescens TaxID=758803 RepID=UPI003649445A
MISVEYREADTKEALDKWARTLGVGVRIVDETWDSIYFQADAEYADGTHLRCRYRQVLPRPLAFRRRERTFIVGLLHEVDGASCYHVRPVIAGLSTDSQAEAVREATIYAGAMVELQRRSVCGATAANLSVYVVTRAADWNP